MLRICLIIVLVTGLAVVGMNFVMVREKITTLVTDRNDQKTQKETALNEVRVTKKELVATTAKLKETETTLATTKTERDAAVVLADKESKRATEVATKLTEVTAQRDSAQGDLAAYVATGFKPEQITTLGKQLKGLSDELEVVNTEKKILVRDNQRLSNKLRELVEADFHVPLPPDLKGKVLVADPKWDFVVLDVGADQGAMEHGELLVSRDGKLVAKLRIETVEKGRSIANVMPGWKLGDVLEGDQVIPAYVPAS